MIRVLQKKNEKRKWSCRESNSDFLFYFIFPSPLLSSHFCLSPSIVVTQTRGHKAGSSPPSPLRCVPSFLKREEFSTFFPRRPASNCAYPRYRALSAVGVLREKTSYTSVQGLALSTSTSVVFEAIYWTTIVCGGVYHRVCSCGCVFYLRGGVLSSVLPGIR